MSDVIHVISWGKLEKQWAAIQVYQKAILFNHPSVLTYLHYCMSSIFLLCCSTAWIFQSVMGDVTWPCTKQKQGLQNSIFCVAVLLSFFFLVIMNIQYLKISRRGGIQYIWRVCVGGGGAGVGGEGNRVFKQGGGREQAYRAGRMYLFSVFLRYNEPRIL